MRGVRDMTAKIETPQVSPPVDTQPGGLVHCGFRATARPVRTGLSWAISPQLLRASVAARLGRRLSAFRRFRPHGERRKRGRVMPDPNFQPVSYKRGALDFGTVRVSVVRVPVANLVDVNSRRDQGRVTSHRFHEDIE